MSKGGMDHKEIKDLLPAYAMSGLDSGDAAALREHLQGCEQCQLELASYGALRGDLGLAAPKAPLPEGAKERMMERAAGTAKATAKATAREAGPRVQSPPSENSHHSSHQPLRPPYSSASEHSHRPRRRARAPWRRLPWVAAVASLLLAFALGDVTWNTYQQNQRMAQEISSQEQTINSVVDIMERADLAVSDVMRSESGALTRVYQAREGDVGMLVFDNLPQLSQGQVYQLWMRSGGDWQSEATFEPEAEGRGSHHELLEPDGGFEKYEAVAVAPAPEGGLQEPPSPSQMTVFENVGSVVASASDPSAIGYQGGPSPGNPVYVSI